MAADMSSTADEEFETILQGIQRDINCLSDNNRTTRRRALDKIRKETLQRKIALTSQVLQRLLNEVIKPLLKMFSDPTEKCRELSVQIVSEFSRKVDDISITLPYIIPTITQRLGQPELIETCEEIRLQIVEMLRIICELCTTKMSVYIDDLIKILQRTVVDPFHEVRKESCRCINILAPAIPQQFYYQGNALVNPLLKTMSHQHSKVRQACIQTIGTVIQYGDGKNVNDVTSHLAQRTFDTSPAVRAMVTTVVGSWLLHLTDRYSYFHKLLPYLLTGLSDEIADIRVQSRRLMDQVGELYAQENEEDFKDKINFETSLKYRLITDVPRPSLGCRILVQRNISQILPAALRDMSEWVVETRKKAASLVFHLLFYAEDNTTQHMEKLLNGLYKSCHDDEPEVVTMVVKSAELAGSFVEPSVFCKLALPHLKSSASSSAAGLTSCLMVLAALVRGADPELLETELKGVCEAIALTDVCSAEQLSCQQQLLTVVHAIMDKCGQQSSPYGFDLFKVIMHVRALSDGSLGEQISSALHKLASLQGMAGVEKLFAVHSKQLLMQLKESHTTWLSSSPERQLFDVLLTQAGDVTGELLFDEAITMFKSCFDVNRDPELRLKMFSLLSRLVMNATQPYFAPYSVTMVIDMIIPNCVWQPGRTAGAVRAAAISCLWAILQKGLLSNEQALSIMKDLLTQLNTCLDDHNATTRLVSCKALQKLLVSCKDSFDGDLLHSIYPELLKRLDDNSDEIRRVVTKTFLAFFQAFPSNYDCDLYKLHLQAIFKGLLIHLDDPTPTLQEAVLDALTQAAHVNPTILREQVDAVKHKHRVSRYCDELLKHIDSIQSSGTS